MITNRVNYKYYKKNFKRKVNIKVYLELTAKYQKFLIEKVLEGKEITLPARMGTLMIKGRKQQIRKDENGNFIGLAPDWVKTKELWDKYPEHKKNKKLVYHLNTHTSSVRYKYLWSKKNVLITNKTLYSLRLTRTNKRAVHKNIMNDIQYRT